MPDIYLLIEGKQEGPYTEDQVHQSLSEGLIPSDLPAWHEGLADWAAVETVVTVTQPSPPVSLGDHQSSADVAPPSPASVAVPTSPSLKPRGYRFLTYMAGAAIVVVGLTVWAIHLIGYSHHFSKFTPRGADAAASNQVADESGSANPASAADVEEARAFIEKTLGQAWGYSTHMWTAAVKVDSTTGHLHIDYNGHFDCLLSSLDPDSIVEKTDTNDDNLVIYTRDHARVVTVSRAEGQDVMTDRIELLNAPDKDRLSKAFAFLINAFPPDAAATQSDSEDLRDKLCRELKSSLSADDSLLKADVSYDKATETLTAECFGRVNNMYGKLVIPIKQIDPQGIKWTQSGMNKSQMLLVTLDKQPGIEVTRRSAYNQGNPYKVGSYEDLYFPTENDAAEFADTITQLCKELGWQPSKY